MNEKQLQHKIVMWFGQTYPQHRGLLFMVDNDTYNRNHAMTKRSIGMVEGVSDLILVNPLKGVTNGVEIKAPGSTHETDHLQQQIDWGKKIIETGGCYCMSQSEQMIKDFISCIIEKGSTMSIYPKLTNSKTFKF